MYSCDKCNRTFRLKFYLKRHMKRITPCNKQLMKDGLLQCLKCNKEFKSYSSLNYHNNNNVCTSVSSNNTVNNTINNIEKQHVNIKNQTNIDKQLNMDNVKVVKFGNEDISYISDDIYQTILGKGYKSVEEFVDHTHFNPDHPENHNIYIADIKNNYVLLYDGLQWNIKDRDEAIEDLIYAKSDYLSVKFDELMHRLSPMDIKKFTNFMKNRDNDIKMKMVKTDLKLMLYNNRHIPSTLRKQLETNMKNQKTIKYKKSTSKDDNFDNILDAIADSSLTKDKIKQIEAILNGSKQFIP
jgi:hypothetical protein